MAYRKNEGGCLPLLMVAGVFLCVALFYILIYGGIIGIAGFVAYKLITALGVVL